MPDTARADKWLWAVRLFKTRSVAAAMCGAGKVKRDGQPLKPATLLRVGDRLEVPFPEGPGTRLIEVVAVIEKRVGAAGVLECCRERTPEQQLMARKLWSEARAEGARGRPTKKDRRELNRMRGFHE